MKKFLIFITSFSLIIVCQLNAQYTNIKINSIPVCGEEWIAMNPKNPNQVVVGTHIALNNPQSNMGYFYSTNGGLNWVGDTLLTTLAQPGADPIILVDTTGNFYYICIANWWIPLPNLDKMLCIKSTNGGINWNNGTAFAQLYPKFDDMPMACIDFSNSLFRNNIYVTWTLFDTLQSNDPNDSSYVYFCRSTNEGTNFSTPIRISRIAGRGNWDNSVPEGPVPCTGINGEVYVCYPHNEQVLFNRSTDGGLTWLNSEIIASNQPGGWLWHYSPVITCDLSNSQYVGSIYICFADLRSGMNDRNVWVIKSTNSGDNWSTPVRVNDDSPGHLQDLPWICVDRATGYIWIVFYDSRNYPNNARYDTYVARSTDGGNTFQNVKVSNITSSTLTYLWLGDYMGITAYNNKVRPVWLTSTGFGNSYMWTAIIDTFIIGIQPISTDVPESFNLYQNYPNPFNPLTKIKFNVPKSEHVIVSIFDIIGREIAPLINEKLSPGTYEVEWDASNYPSGVYFYKLITENYTDSKKMILVK